MKDFITRYFHKVDDYQNEFKSPVAEEELVQVENQLDFKLPADDKNFLRFSNGFEGFINEFFIRFIASEEIYQYTQDYCEEYFPWAIFIGSNGGCEMVVIDKRQTPNQFGLFPYIGEEEDFIPLGNTFEKIIERLYDGTAFEER